MRRYLPWVGLALAAVVGGLAIWVPSRQDRRSTPAPPPIAPEPDRRSQGPAPPPQAPAATRARPRDPPRPGTLPHRNGPFPGDQAGIVTALTARVGEIAPCWATWRAAHPDGPPQPVLMVILGAQGDAGALVGASLASGDGGDFDGCVSRALSDATFDAPPVQRLTLMVPVPLAPSE